MTEFRSEFSEIWSQTLEKGRRCSMLYQDILNQVRDDYGIQNDPFSEALCLHLLPCLNGHKVQKTLMTKIVKDNAQARSDKRIQDLVEWLLSRLRELFEWLYLFSRTLQRECNIHKDPIAVADCLIPYFLQQKDAAYSETSVHSEISAMFLA